MIVKRIKRVKKQQVLDYFIVNNSEYVGLR